VFWALFKLPSDAVSAAFFVLTDLGILSSAMFWTLANDVYDPRQARRIFGFIGGGASLGGAMGSGITSWTWPTRRGQPAARERGDHWPVGRIVA
jgi:ATP/ADP translocase